MCCDIEMTAAEIDFETLELLSVLGAFSLFMRRICCSFVRAVVIYERLPVAEPQEMLSEFGLISET